MTFIQTMKKFKDLLDTDKETLVVVQYTSLNKNKNKEIAGAFEKFGVSYEGALFATIDVDDNEEIAAFNGVHKYPTFQLFKNKIKIEEITTSDVEEVRTLIKKHYKGDEIVDGDYVKVQAPPLIKDPLVKILNLNQWDTTISSSGNNVVFAYFTATWCGPCKKISPVYAAIAADKQDQAMFLKVDEKGCKDIFSKVGVESIPTVLCLKNGKEVTRHTGASVEELKTMIMGEIKIAQVMSIAEECTTEEELRSLLKTNPNPISYDGFEPSGRMHLAQSILKTIHVNKLAKCGIKSLFWIADWHAMLNGKMGGQLKKIKKIGEYMVEVWKACGMDMDHVEFLWAADEINKRPNEYWMLVMNIARQNSMGRVKKCLPIMGKEGKDAEKQTGAHIMYPCMQCADIFYLKANICQLGMDQKQVNLLAREYAELPLVKEKYPVKPVILSHRLLPGLKEGKTKMSVSDPKSAIFVDDTAVEVKSKIKKSFCPPGIVQGNPCMAYLKYIVFAKLGSFTVKRKVENGGDKTYSNYLDLEADYIQGSLHPGDLKPSLSTALNQILEPIRAHFKKGKLKQLLTQVKKLK